MRPKATKPRRQRRARVLPALAALFVAAALMRLVSGVGTALAQDPAPEPPLVQAVRVPPAVLPLRSNPQSDAQLSLEIRDRERAVSSREAALQEREALLAAAQSRVEAQINALQTAETELSATMALADRAAEDDIARLVSVYEAMRPEQAAAVFSQMAPDFAAGFLGRLSPAAAAAILAGIDPRQAYALSAILAGRNALVPHD